MCLTTSVTRMTTPRPSTTHHTYHSHSDDTRRLHNHSTLRHKYNVSHPFLLLPGCKSRVAFEAVAGPPTTAIAPAATAPPPQTSSGRLNARHVRPHRQQLPPTNTPPTQLRPLAHHRGADRDPGGPTRAPNDDDHYDDNDANEDGPPTGASAGAPQGPTSTSEEEFKLATWKFGKSKLHNAIEATSTVSKYDAIAITEILPAFDCKHQDIKNDSTTSFMPSAQDVQGAATQHSRCQNGFGPESPRPT